MKYGMSRVDARIQKSDAHARDRRWHGCRGRRVRRGDTDAQIDVIVIVDALRIRRAQVPQRVGESRDRQAP